MNKVTFEEKKKDELNPSRQNTIWSDIVKECRHSWIPVTMMMKEGNGIVMPDQNNAKVYCVCMKCCGYTYIETAWVGFFLSSPDILEATV